MNGVMNISKASKLTGLSARMIRFYEAEGVSRLAARGTSGYRTFGPEDIATLRFIRNARDLRFELPEIRRLIEHWRQGTESAQDIQEIVEAKLLKLRSDESRIRASRILLESILQCSTWRSQPECELIEYLTAQSDRGNAPTG